MFELHETCWLLIETWLLLVDRISNKIMNSFLSILIPILLHLTDAQRFPNWPADFYWTHDGALNPDNYTCLHFEAPQEPFLNYWDKNFLCVKKRADLLDHPADQWGVTKAAWTSKNPKTRTDGRVIICACRMTLFTISLGVMADATRRNFACG